MKFSKKLFFSAFACTFALGASAQGAAEEPTYLKRDVLTPDKICSQLGSKIKQYPTETATYSAILMNDTGAIGFDGKENSIGIVAHASGAVLNSIEFDWNIKSANGANVFFCARDISYANTSQLYVDDSYIDKITKAQAYYKPSENYRFWGLKKGTLTAYINSITVIWQLAHFRENLTIGNLGTICLPYDVKAEDWVDELTAYTIAGKVMSSTRDQIEALVFEEVDEMKAGVAYLFVPKKSGICLKYYGTEVQQPVESKYGLIGSFENYTFTEDDCRDNNLFLISNNSIRLAGAGAGVGANRAYIKMSKEMPEYHETNSSRKLLVSANGYIETGDSPTIVEMLKAIASLKDGQNQTSTAYDLQGRMVSGTSPKGIVMENGKKKYISVR